MHSVLCVAPITRSTLALWGGTKQLIDRWPQVSTPVRLISRKGGQWVGIKVFFTVKNRSRLQGFHCEKEQVYRYFTVKKNLGPEIQPLKINKLGACRGLKVRVLHQTRDAQSYRAQSVEGMFLWVGESGWSHRQCEAGAVRVVQETTRTRLRC